MGSLTSAIFGKVCYDLSRSPANHLAWLSWDWLCSGQPQCSSRYAAGWSWEKRGALRWMHGHKTEAQGRAVNTCFCEVCWWTAAPYALGNKGIQGYWVGTCSTGKFSFIVCLSLHSCTCNVHPIHCAQCSSLGDTSCFSLSSLAWFSLQKLCFQPLAAVLGWAQSAMLIPGGSLTW